MKSITLKKEVKDKLDAFADGRSNNKAIKKLLEKATVHNPKVKPKQQYYIIKVDEDVLDKLKSCKIYSNESHSDTIDRLLDEYEE